MKKNEIEINGEIYIKKTNVINPVESDHIIVIAQRGWIFEVYKPIKIPTDCGKFKLLENQAK